MSPDRSRTTYKAFPHVKKAKLGYTTGQKFGITPMKQTLRPESPRNGQAKMPLGRIGAQFIYTSDEHNTVTVAKTVQDLEAEN